MIVDDALRRYCSMMYLQQCQPGTLDCKSGESRWDHVMRVMAHFSQWCELWLDGLDEPTIVAALFLKYIQSYQQRKSAVKKWNPWMLEIQGQNWIGGWSIAGKKNYSSEGCHRMDVLYGGELTMHELEWGRENQLVRQTIGGNATSLVHTNKNLTAWNKGSVSCPIFSTVCQRSACVMATKVCAHECFEMKNWKSVAPSREKDVISLAKLLEAGDLYPKESTEKSVFDEDFWWGRICPSKEKAGSDKAKKRETAD